METIATARIRNWDIVIDRANNAAISGSVENGLRISTYIYSEWNAGTPEYARFDWVPPKDVMEAVNRLCGQVRNQAAA